MTPDPLPAAPENAKDEAPRCAASSAGGGHPRSSAPRTVACSPLLAAPYTGASLNLHKDPYHNLALHMRDAAKGTRRGRRRARAIRRWLPTVMIGVLLVAVVLLRGYYGV